MNRDFYIYPICAFCFLIGLLIYFVARKHLFRNEQLFVYTPPYEEEKVMQKHQLIWLRLGLLNGFFIILMLVHTVFDKLADNAVYEIYFTVVMQSLVPIAIYYIVASSSILYPYNVFDCQTHVVTRYMVCPSSGVFSIIVSLLSLAIILPVGTLLSLAITSNISVIGLFNKPLDMYILLAIDVFLAFLANYAIIRAFYNTPRELVLSETTESEYDKAAKRYYGIWRNRLILANLAAGAQLILGGFVTMTNAGEHLMGIRILGLVLLVIVFIYILIQSREFDDPVVVKGMVYPSEKKRETLKRLILSAIIIYAVGAIILL